MGKSNRARAYCTRVEKKPNKIRCMFCGHTMTGITRFKEHLARKRGDVVPCPNCPREVSIEMSEELIKLSLLREDKERRTRQELQRSMNLNVVINLNPIPIPIPPPPPPQQPLADGHVLGAVDSEEEESLILQAIEASKRSLEEEMRKEEEEIKMLEAACRNSIKTQMEEHWKFGEGTSTTAAGSSSDIESYEPVTPLIRRRRYI